MVLLVVVCIHCAIGLVLLVFMSLFFVCWFAFIAWIGAHKPFEESEIQRVESSDPGNH